MADGRRWNVRVETLGQGGVLKAGPKEREERRRLVRPKEEPQLKGCMEEAKSGGGGEASVKERGEGEALGRRVAAEREVEEWTDVAGGRMPRQHPD